MGFSVVVVLYSLVIVISWNMPLFNEDKLNKNFIVARAPVVAENFAELVSTVALTCLEGGGFDHL